MADPAKGIKELDLSEKHLAYFTFTALNDRNDPQDGEGMQYPEGTTTAQRFNTGGWTFFATSLFASGIGPNLEDRSSLDKGDEDLLTYKGRNGLVYFVKTDADNTGNYRLMPICYAGQDDWSLPEQYRFYASYRLKESYQLPSPAVFSEEGEYSYDAHGTNAIKEQLLAKRGGSIAFHADTSLPGQAADSSKYISENWAHYYGEGGNSCNHIVCIVGWDDSYPKESFVPGNQPPADEAGNDAQKLLTAVAPGSATLTVDAGPYGKESVTVTVEKRKLEQAILAQMSPAYTGEPIRPKTLLVSVSRMPGEPRITAEEGKDFQIEYKDNVKCGNARAILVGMGEFEGTELPVDFTIVPARPEITGAELQGDRLTLQFASQKDSGIDGYELSWCPAGAEEAQVMKLPADTVSAEIASLDTEDIYSVSLRAYVDSDDGATDSDAEPVYGQAAVPVIVSTCGQDAAMLLRTTAIIDG